MNTWIFVSRFYTWKTTINCPINTDMQELAIITEYKEEEIPFIAQTSENISNGVVQE